MRHLLLLFTFASLFFGQPIPWPHPPQNQIHPLGNSWGIFQNYGGNPYCHNGADIMTVARAPTTVVRNGYVKAFFQSGDPYNGVTVADSAGAGLCTGYMYYHIERATIRVRVGDTVQVGDTIAFICTWPVAQFHHNHFSKNRNRGTVWPDYGGFIKNPLSELVPDNDSTRPVFTNAVSGRIFAICRNNTRTYLQPDSIYGDVDFICRVEDKVNHRLWWVAIYKLIYTIRDTAGTVVVPPRIVQLSESLNGYSYPEARTVYKYASPCSSNCNYDSLNRRLYFIFTNTDNDTSIEVTDSLECWRTITVPNGPYWVKVTAYDEYGNNRAESMLVRVKNPVGIEERTDKEIILQKMKLAIYPNPSKSVIYFNVSSYHKEPFELKVYDVEGRLVKEFSYLSLRSSRQIVWDRRDNKGQLIPAGVYFIEAKSKSVERRIKLTIL